jgi:hypothetical protein
VRRDDERDRLAAAAHWWRSGARGPASARSGRSWPHPLSESSRSRGTPSLDDVTSDPHEAAWLAELRDFVGEHRQQLADEREALADEADQLADVRDQLLAMASVDRARAT